VAVLTFPATTCMPVGLAAALPATKQAIAAAAAIRKLEPMSVPSVISISQGQHGVQALSAFLLRIRGADDAAVIHLQAQKPATCETKPDTAL